MAYCRLRSAGERVTPVVRLIFIALCASLFAVVVRGGEKLGVGLPVACTLGTDCWVANYPDLDPGPGARDSLCGPRSYDDHDGSDFAIRDLAAMERGVTVRAAAAGVVRSARDGMDDVLVTEPGVRERIAGRECGNGVLVEHADGWQTQYCHLRRGSVLVRPGQAVGAGTPLALVGLSGNTEFPHLHFTLRRSGAPVDPWTGHALAAGCGTADGALWEPAAGLAYEAVALYNAGFAPGPPLIEAIRRGERGGDSLPADAPALVLWVEMFGVRAGDRLQFRIRAPDGAQVLESEQQVPRDQARRFVYVGTRRSGARWMTGDYRGEITLLRGAGAGADADALRRELQATVRIAPDLSR